MNKELGYLNKNRFRLNETFENGAMINSVFEPQTALFRNDGTLLSFDIRYKDDGYVASIALVPENEWFDQGVKFLDDWLAPIGITLLSRKLSFQSMNQSNSSRIFDTLVNIAVSQAIGESVHFLTKGIRDSNLIYVNIYTKVIYRSSPIRYNPAGIFG